MDHRSSRLGASTVPDPGGAAERGLLVGRDRELAVLHDRLDAARRGRGSLVLVAGEAGIGKTRLADAFAEAARGQGALAVWGRCWEAGGAPAYWPWMQVARALLRDPRVSGLGGETRDRLGLVLPELRAAAAATPLLADPDAARFLLFDAVATLLRAGASVAPLVVILDDLHAADEPSLLLLQFVASELADTAAVFVASYRDPELEAGDPRQLQLAQLARHPAARRVSPSALSEEEIGEVVRTTTGLSAPPPLLGAIARESEGNPLFVSEIVRLLADEGRLVSVRDAGPRVTVPDTVRAVIARRVDRLSDQCRSVLQLASVIGREFGLELLTELGRSANDVLAAVDEATGARVVQDVPGAVGRWRFAHGLMRDVLYDSIPLAERTALHDRVGRALEELVGVDAPEHVSELAHHAVAAAPAGDPARAVRYSRLAAARATAAVAHEEAVRHLRNALAALELDRSSGEAERCRVLVALGEAAARAGLADARDHLRQAAQLAERLELADELGKAAIAWGGRFVWARAGADTEIIPLLERAIAARREDDALKARLMARLAGALRSEPDKSRRGRLSAEAVSLARRLGDTATLVYTLSGRLGAIAGPDDIEQQTRIVDEIEALADATGDEERISDARWLRLYLLATLGAPAGETAALLDRFATAVQRLKQPPQAWYLGVMRTVFALAEGRYDGVEAAIDETRETGRHGQDWDAEFSARVARFALARERGELEAVLPSIVGGTVDLSGYWLFSAAQVYVEAETGRIDAARRHLHEFAERGFGNLPRDNNFLWATVHLAEAASRLGDRSAIEQLLDVLRPYSHLAASAATEVIAGPVGRVVGDLAAALGRFDVAEDAYARALELVERAGWRPWEAWTRYSIAGMLRRRAGPGDAERAEQELAAASSIASALGMPALQRRLAADGAGLIARPSEPVAPRAAPPQTDAAGSRAMTARDVEASFVREGDVWAITFEERTTRLRDSKGLQYLRRLLAVPGREVPSVDLAAGSAAGDRSPARHDRDLAVTGNAGDAVLDAEARAAYRARLVELQADIDEAEALGDRERAGRYREEFEFLARELTAATGLGGRSRAMSSPAERARQSVGKAIREAIDRIERSDPALGQHLRLAVRTGVMCVYAPDPRAAIRWRT